MIAAALTAFAVGILVGCGASNQHFASARRARGHAVFERSCAACHTLSRSSNPVREGGSLVDPYFTVPDIESFARVMPVRPPLSNADLLAVARYIRSAIHPRHRHRLQPLKQNDRH